MPRSGPASVLVSTGCSNNIQMALYICVDEEVHSGHDMGLCVWLLWCACFQQ